MSRAKDKDMSEEDRILWHQVARTAKPLKPEPVAPKKKAVPLPPMAQQPILPVTPPHSPQMPSYRPEPPKPAVAGHIDRQTTDKIASGRLQLEARVDLHGMRQDEAYSLLLSFVSRAHDRGVRYVLVITGKGSSSGGDGVLRRSVPLWLKTPPFRAYVSGLEQASRGHGGSGALYVRIKRRQA